MDWIHRATHSRIKPLVDFGKNLRGYVQGIIAAADFKINTSVLEGVNNKIKQIKRRAYGFRDDLYFFLRNLFKSTLNNRLHRNLACVIDKSSRGAKLERAFEELP